MAYWLDEGWHRWPEIMRAGTAAAGLYARCGDYIADTQTDGFVPAEVARMYGTPEWVTRLVDVGLWLVEEHGFRDNRYLELNATKEQIEERKKKAAARQARYAAGLKRQSRGSGTSADASVIRPPSPSSPKGEEKGKGAGGRHEPDLDEMSGHCRICDFPAANQRHIRSIKNAS